ncbi:MAG: non-heme iron oxygenase ferredoxin subunit [Candidatus Aenigmarchaeota archaeon]|nr:non-heme iron oxygenase ferredoxin subunit [Candidatus Aenigmarchaeota archaeon]
MVFVKVAAVSDIPIGKMLGVKAKGKAILIANIGGKLHAMADTCTHASCGLSRGEIEGAVVTCPCHGSRFDVRDGKVLEGPAKLPARVFDVKVDGKSILVNV